MSSDRLYAELLVKQFAALSNCIRQGRATESMSALTKFFTKWIVPAFDVTSSPKFYKRFPFALTFALSHL